MSEERTIRSAKELLAEVNKALIAIAVVSPTDRLTLADPCEHHGCATGDALAFLKSPQDGGSLFRDTYVAYFDGR